MQEITSLARYTTKRDGSQLVTSKGKPYTSVKIKTVEHGDNIISGFGNEINAHWKVGDKVDIIVEKKGEYLNFSMPKKESMAPETVARLINMIEFGVIGRLDKIEHMLKGIYSLVQNVPEDVKMPDFGEEQEEVTRASTPFD